MSASTCLGTAKRRVTTLMALRAARVVKSAPHPYESAIHAVRTPWTTAPVDPAPLTRPDAVPIVSCPYPAASTVSEIDAAPSP